MKWRTLLLLGLGFGLVGVLALTGRGVYEWARYDRVLERSDDGTFQVTTVDTWSNPPAQTGRGWEFHSSGVIGGSGSYENGQKVGVWAYYDPLGEINFEIDYDEWQIRETPPWRTTKEHRDLSGFYCESCARRDHEECTWTSSVGKGICPCACEEGE